MQSTKTLISITTQLKLFCAVLILATLAITETNAQTLPSPPNKLQLGLDSDSDINLDLIEPTTIDGKTYYYLDHSEGGTTNAGDNVTHVALNNLLNDGNATEDTLPGAPHNGRDDARSVIKGIYALILPTQEEFGAFSSVPTNRWEPTADFWASTPGVDAGTFVTRNIFNQSFSSASDTEARRVVFQVRLADLTFTFDEGITDQFYNIDRTVSVTLPEAFGGISTLTYTLTPKINIPAGLKFSSTELTLTGTPNTETDAVTLTYTATDSVMATAELTFMVTVGPQKEFGFASTEVAKIVNDGPFYRDPHRWSG